MGLIDWLKGNRADPGNKRQNEAPSSYEIQQILHKPWSKSHHGGSAETFQI
jgi:hypothetical protein